MSISYKLPVELLDKVTNSYVMGLILTHIYCYSLRDTPCSLAPVVAIGMGRESIRKSAINTLSSQLSMTEPRIHRPNSFRFNAPNIDQFCNEQQSGYFLISDGNRNVMNAVHWITEGFSHDSFVLFRIWHFAQFTDYISDEILAWLYTFHTLDYKTIRQFRNLFFTSFEITDPYIWSAYL